MNCDEIEELLSDLLDDELPSGARAGVESHLASCERCAAVYKKLRRTVRFVRSNSSADLRPGTSGGVYMAFTRALVDTDHGASFETILRSEGTIGGAEKGASQ